MLAEGLEKLTGAYPLLQAIAGLMIGLAFWMANKQGRKDANEAPKVQAANDPFSLYSLGSFQLPQLIVAMNRCADSLERIEDQHERIQRKLDDQRETLEKRTAEQIRAIEDLADDVKDIRDIKRSER